ncbi:MAG TPA: hypothetical protein VFD27_03495 [Chthoniobacteraceae bacterium]|jgi:hypothetical protein|nr:hypothetical protein [Chthoniobacteraceae bacterium]
MSVKETIHKWIDTMPEDSPGLRALYEEARLDLGIDEAKESLREHGGIPIEEVRARFEERCRKRASA